MNNPIKQSQILVIENDYLWADRIAGILRGFRSSVVKILDSYDAAERFLVKDDLERFDAIIIDVRLREQIYDQGGLALLDIAKCKRPNFPALILTAYAYDYPGLRDITTRYRNVLTYDKEVFLSSHDTVLNALLSKLPPQIGDQSSLHPTPRNATKTSRPDRAQLHEIFVGAVVVALVLVTAGLALLLFEVFSAYSLQLNIVFSVVVVALLCVLLRVFKPDIVHKAVELYKKLASAQVATDDGGNDDESMRNDQQRTGGDK